MCVYSVYSGQTSHAISCSLLIWCKLKSDSFRSQGPEDGSRLGAICQGWLTRRPARLPPKPRVPDGGVEGPEGSHQCAVQDDLGQTSYVHRQECLELVFDIWFSVQHIKGLKYNLYPLFSLSLLQAVNTQRGATPQKNSIICVKLVYI